MSESGTSLLFLKSGDVVAEASSAKDAVAFDGTVSYLDEIHRICDGGRECAVVSTCDRDAELVVDGIRMISLDVSSAGGRLLGTLTGWRKLWFVVRRVRPNVIVALDAGYYALVLWLLSRLFGSRLVLAAPGQISGARTVDRLRGWAFRFAARSRRTLLVLGRGSYLTDEILKAGVDSRKVSAYFPEYSPSMSSMSRDADSVRTGVPEVVFLGRLAPVKGVDALAPLATALASIGGVLRIIGDGPCADDLRRELAAFTNSGSVVMEGAMPTIAALERVARADLSIVPSRMEGIAKSAMESIIVGVPVVAYRVGGIPEWVADDVTGALVTPGDVDALCDTVTSLLSDKGRLASVRESTRKVGLELVSKGPTFTAAVRSVIDGPETTQARGAR